MKITEDCTHMMQTRGFQLNEGQGQRSVLNFRLNCQRCLQMQMTFRHLNKYNVLFRVSVNSARWTNRRARLVFGADQGFQGSA